MSSEDLGSSTATVLFTDLVGSTEARARLGDEAADDLRRHHDRLLATAVEAHRGRVVKGLGDGLMATFAGAADGLAAAVAMQRALHRHNRAAGGAGRLDVRIGLSAGDVSFEDGDYFGTPVVEAARLCAAAEAGRILVADVVRILAGSRGGHQFMPLGGLELKGLPEPVSAVEVAWAPEAGSVVPLPAGLDRPGSFRFVGRAAERDQLMRAWKEVVGGERRAVLVGGEPGIGKTRLLAELARGVHDDGAVVLYGRCEEELGVPYQPFAEALGAYAAACPAEELADQVGPLGGELVRLVPSLSARVSGLPEPLRAEPETERYRLFEAVREFLAGIAGQAPALFVVDDLHWAAKPTLVLLSHLLRSAGPVRLLVAGTYRDTELTRTHPLAETLADLRRELGVERLALSGLDEAEVASFVEAVAGHELDAEAAWVARAIHAETEGNPFFVGEVLRHLAESGAVAQREGRWSAQRPLAELGIPEGVREVVGRRLSRLMPAANEILGVAAALGREFDLGILVEAAEVGAEEVLDALERAEEARLVAGVPGHSERYAFAHALVRSTLYEELPTSRRLRLHRRIGQVIESRPDAATRTAELARHFCEAVALGEAGRAVAYARSAGDQAGAGLAFEEAAAHYERALVALGFAEAPDPGLYCDLQIALGDSLRRAGDGRYREVLIGEAAGTARRLGDARRLAEVVLSRNVGLWSALGKVEDDLVDLAEEALAGLGKEDSALRARLLAALAVELSWRPDVERRAALSREAVAMARRLGDRRQLVRVLVASHRPAHSPDNVGERLARSAEAAALADELDDPEVGFWAYFWRYFDLLEAGEPEWRAAFKACERRADRLRQPYFAWLAGVLKGAQALTSGQFDEAERVIAATRRIGRDGGAPESAVEGFATGQLFVLRYEQGQLIETEPAIASLVESQPGFPLWRCRLALLYCETGARGEARTHFESVATNLDALPRDVTWLNGMVTLVLAAASLGDTGRSAVMYDRLAPYAGRNSYGGTGSMGSVDLGLGLLAATLGRLDEAEAHFAAAVDMACRMGAPPWLTRAHAEWARMLAAAGRPGYSGRARDLARQALSTAEELGQIRVAETARAVLSQT